MAANSGMSSEMIATLMYWCDLNKPNHVFLSE